MKKKLKTLLSLVLVGIFFVGCSSNGSSSDAKGDDQLKVALLIPGTLGDKSFFDASNKGLELVKKELNAETKVIEMGTDKTKWEPTLNDVSEQDWDIIISGTWEITELLNETAELYPDKKYINFDTTEASPAENVYSMFYKTNELAFLTGAAAALATTSDIEGMNADKTIGFIGGMDNPGINDFLVGYIEGAKFVDPEVKVAVSYAGDFTNPAKGKEMAISMFNTGVDVIFQVAGQTGLGVIDAAKEVGKYAIGVDSDQAEMFMDTDPEKADRILTSAVKQMDQSILRAVKLASEGKLEFGIHETLGIKENGIGLAKNEIYKKIMPTDLQSKIDEVQEEVANGKVEIPTAFGLDAKEIAKIRDSVRP